MIYLRRQVLRTLIVREAARSTYYRKATRTNGIVFPDMDDIRDDPSINHGGVVLITSLRELRTFVRTFFFVASLLRILMLCITVKVAHWQLTSGFTLLGIAVVISSCVGVFILDFLVPWYSTPSGRVVDQLGNYVDLDTGASSLHGGCVIW